MIAFAGWDTDWPFVAAPFVFYFFTVFWLLVMGDHEDLRNPIRMFFRRISTKMREITGYPGWSMAGALSGLLVLAVAAMGLYWDVAYHVDHGRDKQLFTPSHTMILLGLGGMVYAAVIAVIFANNDEEHVGFSVFGVRIPWSALLLGMLGIGGVAAFPLDNLWHEAYGIDVTLWSPTHLQLVAGGGLGPIAVLLMLLEGRPKATPTWLGKGIEFTTAGAVLVGLTCFEGEFDFRVPQFQPIYLPILFAVVMGFGLVLARMALGRGGAIGAVVSYLILRFALGALVGGALHHTYPRFPLYVVGALCIEGVAELVGTENTLRFALAAGAAAGFLGVIGEMIWVQASGWFTLHGNSQALKATVLSLAGAVCAAIIAAGLGRAWRHGAGLESTPMPLAALGVAFLAVIAVLAFPLPRNVGKVDAVIRLTPAGDRAMVAVDITPADAAHHASGFGVMSWQGGGTQWTELKETDTPGHYVAEKAVPITGRWKSMVSLDRGSQVMAAPVYMPADPEIGASAVPAVPERHTTFVRNTSVLLREAKDGPAWPALLSYLGVALVVCMWLGLFSLTGRKVGDAEAEELAAAASRTPTGWDGGTPRRGQPCSSRPATTRPGPAEIPLKEQAAADEIRGVVNTGHSPDSQGWSSSWSRARS
ncbi:MAG TPA: hypothetical protein VFJ85_14740 [Acidimicrobiales bacterium]|nr:hypothetical protein [Acidimicrobiales bacterium]